jgi:chitinase
MKFIRIVVLGLSMSAAAHAQTGIIGYYAGRASTVDSFPVNKLTEIIFSFCHLRGNELAINNAFDTARLRHLVDLKKTNPDLKVTLSLGGWGGCRTCSDVFRTRAGRKEFVRSVKRILQDFNVDGIDLDWEYPNLVNIPGYPYGPYDVNDFTWLVRRLRRVLGPRYVISFAAGGYTAYLERSIDWKRVMPYVTRVNLMTYDLVNGYDTVTGHHTPLYGSPGHPESVDHCVRWLEDHGVPDAKMAIGAAFYGRIFDGVDSASDGLFQHGHFRSGISFRDISRVCSPDSGFVYHWDSIAKAPWLYNAAKRFFVTYDDSTSMRLKTEYVVAHHLNGVMFWQLGDDTYFRDGLLDDIYRSAGGANTNHALHP